MDPAGAAGCKAHTSTTVIEQHRRRRARNLFMLPSMNAHPANVSCRNGNRVLLKSVFVGVCTRADSLMRTRKDVHNSMG
jgi:hypothetical protein